MSNLYGPPDNPKHPIIDKEIIKGLLWSLGMGLITTPIVMGLAWLFFMVLKIIAEGNP